MQSFKQLNIDLKNYLEEAQESFIKDLVHIIDGDRLNYLEGKNEKDLKALYFEYEYDYLDIIAWGTDKAGDILTKTYKMGDQRRKQENETDDWTAFIPEKLWTEASDFQEQYEDEEDFDEVMDDYNDEKYEIFENWFFDSWKKASIQTENRTDAYFSIHDSYFKTDLNTLQSLNNDEIAERYTS
ncbi:hypothetical protein ACM46_22525 [Chryseobacterium angstadtii]|uniref:Uncharacterized protein n=1 Tax=Chryseobacterium angstadtii TaxID=558151 RepID=A0A0J7HWI4_9FLAO|nr:hypothetical protein [Chryseobacterium angstadtii]KMQ58477.1 hypothetical protein ACM46_22525 [Chryseobacterium angstadtii]